MTDRAEQIEQLRGRIRNEYERDDAADMLEEDGKRIAALEGALERCQRLSKLEPDEDATDMRRWLENINAIARLILKETP